MNFFKILSYKKKHTTDLKENTKKKTKNFSEIMILKKHLALKTVFMKTKADKCKNKISFET